VNFINIVELCKTHTDPSYFCTNLVTSAATIFIDHKFLSSAHPENNRTDTTC